MTIIQWTQFSIKTMVPNNIIVQVFTDACINCFSDKWNVKVYCVLLRILFGVVGISAHFPHHCNHFKAVVLLNMRRDGSYQVLESFVISLVVSIFIVNMSLWIVNMLDYKHGWCHFTCFLCFHSITIYFKIVPSVLFLIITYITIVL